MGNNGIHGKPRRQKTTPDQKEHKGFSYICQHHLGDLQENILCTEETTFWKVCITSGVKQTAFHIKVIILTIKHGGGCMTV